MSEWLNSWDTGISSKSIFHYMTLGAKSGGPPSDPADLGRCLRLLERFPEWKPRMPEMASVGRGWDQIMPKWDDIVASFFREAGGDTPPPRAAFWSAPITYAKMRNAFGERA